MASTLLPHSRLLLKGSSKLLPSSTMAAPTFSLLLSILMDRQISLSNKEEIGKREHVAAVAMAALAAAGPAVALVDERMSTEGTGLPFGLSNNLLGWILAGMFGLIWALYFVYASSLDEDEDSGLSL
ncbi:photosystem II reaction center W protein [Cucumis melo var. makuwa]|uniref:PSII 6.1 kDa protein n=1 Tax=Cucumis melo var. makuwa TaxID=1194695 RepID=A0A5A7VDK1_CUCMM|nr:photosystem II reaction center W protein [Cucumis melo var. makuwa]